MAEPPTLARKLSTLFEALPQPQLIEVARRAMLGNLQRTCRQKLGGRSVEEVVAAIFPEFPKARVMEAARKISLNVIKDNYWKSAPSLPDLRKTVIHCPDRDVVREILARQGPMILAFWHLGASPLLPLGLQSVGVPATVIAGTPPSPWLTRSVSPDIKIVAKEDQKQSAIPFRQALDCLKKGGVAALAADGNRGGKNIVVPFLGRRLAVSRSLALLARLTGAPVRPCVLTWGAVDWSMNFRIFDPIRLPARDAVTPEAFEQAVLETVGRHFDKISRSLPGQLRIEQLARIANSARLTPGR